MYYNEMAIRLGFVLATNVGGVGEKIKGQKSEPQNDQLGEGMMN